VDRETGARILLLLWRVWHLRNDIILGEGKGSIQGSANFLSTYADSLDLAMKSIGLDVCMKGKGKVGEEHNHRRSGEDKSSKPAMLQKSKPPPPGWVKMNTDAAFCLNSRTASTGIVIRDAEGKVLLTAWQVL
jgi:hypothetical protein